MKIETKVLTVKEAKFFKSAKGVIDLEDCTLSFDWCKIRFIDRKTRKQETKIFDCETCVTVRQLKIDAESLKCTAKIFKVKNDVLSVDILRGKIFTDKLVIRPIQNF